MPGTVRPVADERDGLLAYLSQQRDGLRYAAHGLDDARASSSPTVSTLSLAGLIKHVAHTERHWIAGTLAGRELPEHDYENSFRLIDGETLAGMLAFYDEVAAETESIVAELTDMDYPVPVPKGVPWFPDDVDFWSARWVLLHVIEETARHAGHADIIRESIDGKTMYGLMAEAEGWTASWTS